MNESIKYLKKGLNTLIDLLSLLIIISIIFNFSYSFLGVEKEYKLNKNVSIHITSFKEIKNTLNTTENADHLLRKHKKGSDELGGFYVNYSENGSDIYVRNDKQFWLAASIMDHELRHYKYDARGVPVDKHHEVMSENKGHISMPWEYSETTWRNTWKLLPKT